MTIWLALEDYADGERVVRAGSLLDDAVLPVAALATSGLAAVIYNASTMASPRRGYLAQRASKPGSFSADGDLTAMLLAAGAIGGGGGGGVTAVTASPPLISSGGLSPDIALADGSESGDLLIWDGTAWTPTQPPPPGVIGVTAGAPLVSSGGATPDITLGAGTSAGDLLAWNGSAWLPAELPGRSRGFLSTSLADHYAAPSAGTIPGASNFIAIVTFVPAANRNSARVETLAECRSGSTGWAIRYEYGVLTALAFDGSGVVASAIVPTTTAYAPNQQRGRLHTIALRAFQNGGLLNVEVWLGPERYGVAAAGAGMSPGTLGTFRLGNAVVFGDEGPINGIVTGFACFNGTVTDQQMRVIMGDALQRGRIDSAALAWNAIYQGADVQAAPATWSGTPGALNRVGAPSGISATFFPPI